ncbi:H+/gluconate symporter-like permease [Cerasibacillus quisquiliarum]|uniref:Permease n=1 Tax=Cerasibacillus quisquiliarum TaxID=227865 RepID=A0A511UZ63_9BACI|nr:GntP family permease [Cerasibacillus quisquiliarum]MBB5146994.1 H+/gluconate symporter-like permease [Cerasibacillus quisquiliarum]GEN31934.1 permease [Cerasibacillus quisquiliarum]
MLSIIGLIGSLALLIYFTMRGINIIISAVFCSLILALTGGLNIIEALTEYYMEGFTNFFKSWFLIFLAGAIFGKVMEDTRAAQSIAFWFQEKVGSKGAVLAVVGASAIMTYGGVSVYIVAFCVYPIAVSLFRHANLPHRFIPAALVFGSISFTMTSPGSPEIQNIIPTQHFGTTPMAGGWIGFLGAFIIMIAGGFALQKMVGKAVKNGETFQLPYKDTTFKHSTNEKLPHILISLIPLIIVVSVVNILSKYIVTEEAVLVALVIGALMAWILMFPYTKTHMTILTKGTENALVAIANTCGVVGFGAVASQVPAFSTIVDKLTNMPGLEYVGLAIAVTLIAGITGSAAGRLGIALPILAPIYLAQGLDPGAMHRISAFASGGLDSLPHNGYIVTTVQGVCRETHQKAYKPIFMISVVIPTIVLFFVVLLYTFF